MSKYGISYAPIRGAIQIGRLNKKGNMFLEDKEYQTNEALYSVIMHVLEDYKGAMDFTVGEKTFHVEVSEQ